MLYRELGKTGLRVSRLGFGAMRLPEVGEGDSQHVDREKAIPMIHRAFEAGVNYIDSAVMYCHGDSERVVGEALEGWRDKVTVSTKNHYLDEDEKPWWENLENSLKKLRVDCIDLYCVHAINWKNYTEKFEPRALKWFERAKDQGMIRRICCSFHDKNDALMKIVDAGFAEVVTLQYNMLDRQLEEGIAYAHEKGMGVVVMGPVGGGRLGGEAGVLEGIAPGFERIPELALRFVLSNANVDLAISGMSAMEQVEENLATACVEEPLDEEELGIINAQLDRLQKAADVYCTGCEYCLPCESEIHIPRVFQLYNQGRVYGLWDYAREQYAFARNHPKIQTVEACTECGTCEPKCPQEIPIRDQLKEAHEALIAEDAAEEKGGA